MTASAALATRREDQSELGALAELAAEGFDGAVARVQELHGAVADRSFAAGGPPRAAHDAIATAVYAAVRGGGRLLGAGLARAVQAGGGGPRLSDTPRGRLAQGALNGLYGDRLDDAGSPLAVPMAIRAGGRDIAAAAFPGAGPRPVVLVHGLCESDAAWGIRREARGGTYATRVLAGLGATPVTIRYNSGLHVSENGRRLDALLEDLVESWPVAVERLALVGHSMGGLVVRSAAHSASARGHRWPELVDTTIALGTPHAGAPLEQAAHLVTYTLNAFPESRPVGAVLGARSAGIKDLRHGRLVDAEWDTPTADALRGFTRADVPLIPGATHHVVAATLTESPAHPVARVVGDLLVLAPSAHELETESRTHVGGHDHFDLLNSPALDDLLRRWLTPA
jgi:triacylglycerol lipase